MRDRNFIRGSVYYIRSYFTEVGSEEKAGRPAVIVSNNAINSSDLGVVEICYMTLRSKKDLPTRVLIEEGPCNNSTVLCEQVSTVSIDRIGDFLTVLNDSDMEKVDRAIMKSLDLEYLASHSNDGVDKTNIKKLEAERDALKMLNDMLFKKLSGEE